MAIKTRKTKSFYKTEISGYWEDLRVGDLIKFSGGSKPLLKVFIPEEKVRNARLIQTRDYRTNNYKTYIPKQLAKKFCDENDIMIGRYGIHELCHLVHHNHTKKFIELQDKEMPDWEKWKLKLEKLLA